MTDRATFLQREVDWLRKRNEHLEAVRAVEAGTIPRLQEENAQLKERLRRIGADRIDRLRKLNESKDEFIQELLSINAKEREKRCRCRERANPNRYVPATDDAGVRFWDNGIRC